MFHRHVTLGVASVMFTFAAQAQSAQTAEKAQQTAAATVAVAFSAVRRAQIVNHIGDALGVLDDVVVDGRGRIVHLIIAHGGILGLGEFKRRVDAGVLPPITAGKFVLAGLTADGIMVLPEYVEDAVAQAVEDYDPPVCGANQTAPQNATTYIPVGPSTVTRKPVSPGSQVTTVTGPDNTRPTILVEIADRPGDGMAPQEGTGTSPTLIDPFAPGALGEQGKPNSSDPVLTAGYAREDIPPNQPYVEDMSDEDTAVVRFRDDDPSTTSSLASAGSASGRGDADTARWRIGRVLGTQLRGLDSGSSVKDVRFEGDRAAAITLARGNAQNSSQEVAFEHLNIAGTSWRPHIALNGQR